MTKRKVSPMHPWATVDPLDRLLRKVRYDGGCWTWTGTKNRNGYGQIHDADGKPGRMVHRVAYELLVGSIAPGLQLDHMCRNPACCNPIHLDPVTCRENVRRGASYRGDKDECVNGHPFTVENTGWRAYGGRDWRFCKACKARLQAEARVERRWKRKPWAERPHSAAVSREKRR